MQLRWRASHCVPGAADCEYEYEPRTDTFVMTQRDIFHSLPSYYARKNPDSLFFSFQLFLKSSVCFVWWSPTTLHSHFLFIFSSFQREKSIRQPKASFSFYNATLCLTSVIGSPLSDSSAYLVSSLYHCQVKDGLRPLVSVDLAYCLLHWCTEHTKTGRGSSGPVSSGHKTHHTKTFRLWVFFVAFLS